MQIKIDFIYKIYISQDYIKIKNNGIDYIFIQIQLLQEVLKYSHKILC